MTPFGPPAAAEKRYETYVGGGQGLAEEGVKVNVYMTDSSNEGERENNNDCFILYIVAENHFHGNFATACIPVTIGRRSVNGAPGRQERSDYEHLVYVDPLHIACSIDITFFTDRFYNITGTVDVSVFAVPSSCQQ